MSASSRPTRRPRSRRPSARLSAVVDLPTPPLPEATAMTAATPGISRLLRHRRRRALRRPVRVGPAARPAMCRVPARRGGGGRRARLALGGQRDHRGGDAGNGAHGGFRLGARTLSQRARLRGIDIDREEHLAVSGGDRRQHIGIGRARRRAATSLWPRHREPVAASRSMRIS